LSLSPDGTRLAVAVNEGRTQSIWTVDLQRGTKTKLSTEGNNNHVPVWLPDGTHPVYSSDRAGPANLFVQAADGSGKAERLLESQLHQDPGSWSRDGRWLAFAEEDPSSSHNLWAYDVAAHRARLFRGTAANEKLPALSQDGQWLAYASDESGRFEVYAEAFPGGGKRVQLSVDGGTEPVWSPKAQGVFFRNAAKLMSVSVTTGSTLSAAVPVPLFDDAFIPAVAFGPTAYAVSPDGQSFYFERNATTASAPPRIHVIVNWLDEFKRRVAAK
jgi:Tol biopolymer transport system component